MWAATYTLLPHNNATLVMCATRKVNLDLQRDRNSRQPHVAIFALSSPKWLCATAPTSLPCCPWSAEAGLWMCVVQPQPTLAEHSVDKLVDIVWYKTRYVTLLAWERRGLYQTEDVPVTSIRNGWQRNITLWIRLHLTCPVVKFCALVFHNFSGAFWFKKETSEKSLMSQLHVLVPVPLSYFVFCCAIYVIMEQYLYTRF